MVHNMKMKKILFILLVSFNQFTYSEIENKEFLSAMFDGCIGEEVDWIHVGGHFEYCGCFVNGISEKMDIQEAMSIGLQYGVEGNLEPLLENKKFMTIAMDCVSKIIE